MKFEDSGLPKSYELEKVFSAFNAFYGNDHNDFFQRSLSGARFLAKNLQDKNPAIIGAMLIIPAMTVYGGDFSQSLQGTAALEHAKDYAAACYKNGAQPSKIRTMFSLASLLDAIKLIDREISFLGQYGSSGKSNEVYKKNTLLPRLKRIETGAQKDLLDLQKAEPKLVKTFNSAVRKTKKQLTAPTPKARR